MSSVTQFFLLAWVPMVYNFTSALPPCSCHIDPTCVGDAAFFEDLPNSTVTYIVPGFVVGCQAVESALKSNLHVLYNQSWIDQYRARIRFDNVNSFSLDTIALDPSVKSQYNMTTPIQMIVEKIMIEDWHYFINYSAYYEQCHPTECRYTYVVKHDIIYIITTIIGLIGGLVTVLQWIIPPFVKLIRRYCCKRHHQVSVDIIPIPTTPKNN